MLAAEELGLAQHCLAMPMAYLKERRQFARPIGSFQALKRRRSAKRGRRPGTRAPARLTATRNACSGPRHRLHLGAPRSPVSQAGGGVLGAVRHPGAPRRPGGPGKPARSRRLVAALRGDRLGVLRAGACRRQIREEVLSGHGRRVPARSDAAASRCRVRPAGHGPRRFRLLRARRYPQVRIRVRDREQLERQAGHRDRADRQDSGP
jgi:hypothetical protein